MKLVRWNEKLEKAQVGDIVEVTRGVFIKAEVIVRNFDSDIIIQRAKPLANISKKRKSIDYLLDLIYVCKNAQEKAIYKEIISLLQEYKSD